MLKYIVTTIIISAIIIIAGCETPEDREARRERAIISKVKSNMHSFQVAVEGYASEHNDVYPQNGDISWAKNYLPKNFKNPINGLSGEGGAYISGEARTPGIVGFKSDAEGRHYEITGYGVDKPIEWKLYNGE